MISPPTKGIMQAAKSQLELQNASRSLIAFRRVQGDPFPEPFLRAQRWPVLLAHMRRIVQFTHTSGPVIILEASHDHHLAKLRWSPGGSASDCQFVRTFRAPPIGDCQTMAQRQKRARDFQTHLATTMIDLGPSKASYVTVSGHQLL